MSMNKAGNISVMEKLDSRKEIVSMCKLRSGQLQIIKI